MSTSDAMNAAVLSASRGAAAAAPERPVDVSVVIVSYNTRDMTREAIRSLYEQTPGLSLQVIAVDNASSDGSAAMIRGEFPRVELIAQEKNTGFAAANNLAAERARGEYLLLLNPDTVVIERAVEKLVEFARARPRAGMWGGRTLFGDRSLNHTSCWAKQTAWNLSCRAFGLTLVSKRFDGERFGTWRHDTVRQVDIVTGCFLLLKLETWKKLGGFDAGFFMYGEEADLCLRAHRLGVRPVVTPEATIIHYGGQSDRVKEDKLVKLLGAKAMLIRRHWPGWQVWYGLLLLKFYAWSRGAAALSKKPSRRELGEAWRGAWRRRAEWDSQGAAHV